MAAHEAKKVSRLIEIHGFLPFLRRICALVPIPVDPIAPRIREGPPQPSKAGVAPVFTRGNGPAFRAKSARLLLCPMRPRSSPDRLGRGPGTLGELPPVVAARHAVAAPQSGRKAAMLCSARVGVISRARFAAARAFQSSDMISRDLRNAPLAALGQE